MKRLAGVGIALCCVALVGCFDLEEELRINADGSGSAKARIEAIPQAIEALAGLRQIPGTTRGFPLSLEEQDMRAWFERRGVEVADLTVQDRPDGGKVFTVALAFDDLREFASAEFAHFSMTAGEGDSVLYRAPLFASSQPAGSFFPGSPDWERTGFAITKFMFRGARARCEVTFPGTVLETNGTLTEPHTAVWEWSMDDMGFETFQAGMQARFRPDGLSFELPVGKAEQTAPLPEHAAIEAVELAETKEPVSFQVALHSVRMERELEVATASKDSELEVTLSVRSEQGPQPAAVRDVVLHKAVTDTGEVLRLKRSHGHVRQAFSPSGQMTGYEARPNLSLNCPSRGSSILQVLEGELNLVVSEGTKSARIAPIRDWLGKRVEHPALQGLVVHLDSISRSGVKVRLGKQADELIQEVHFEDPEGRPLSYDSASSSHAAGRPIERTYDLETDPEGAIIFEVHKNPKTCKVPFSFRDVPLP